MIRTLWKIYEYNPTTGLFENPQEILAPNSSFSPSIKSTRSIETLVDGSQVMVKPAANSTKNPITFSWELTAKSEIKDLIQNYIQQDLAVKIDVNPEASSYDADFYGDSVQSLQGYFLECEAQLAIGVAGPSQLYTIRATFQPFEVL